MARRFVVENPIPESQLTPTAEPVNTFMTPAVAAPVVKEILDLAPLSQGLSRAAMAWTEANAARAEEAGVAAYGNAANKEAIEKYKAGDKTALAAAMKAGNIPNYFSPLFYKGIEVLATRDHLRDYRNELSQEVERVSKVVTDTGRIDNMDPAEAIAAASKRIWDKYAKIPLMQSYWAQAEVGKAKGAIDDEFSAAVTKVHTEALKQYELTSIGRDAGDIVVSSLGNPTILEKDLGELANKYRTLPVVDMQVKMASGGLASIRARHAAKELTDSQAHAMVYALMRTKINGRELEEASDDFAVSAGNFLETLQARIEDDTEKKLREIDLKGNHILDILLQPMDPKIPMSERLAAAETIIKDPAWEYANTPSIIRQAELQIAAARNPPVTEDSDTRINLELAIDSKSPDEFAALAATAMVERKIRPETYEELVKRSKANSAARNTVAADPKLRNKKLEWVAQSAEWENEYGSFSAKYLGNAASKAEAWLEGQLLELEADTNMSPADKLTKRATIEAEADKKREVAIDGAKKEIESVSTQFKEYSVGGVKPNNASWLKAESILGPTALRLYEMQRQNYIKFEMFFEDRPNRMADKFKRLVRMLGTASTDAESWWDTANGPARLAAQEVYRKMAKDGGVDDSIAVMDAMEAAYKKSLRENLASDTALQPATKQNIFQKLFHGDPYGYTMDVAEIPGLRDESAKFLTGIKSNPDSFDGDELKDFAPELANNGTRNGKHSPEEAWGDEDVAYTFYGGAMYDMQQAGKLLPASDPRIGKNGAIDFRTKRLSALSAEIGASKNKRGVVLEAIKLYGITERELATGMLDNAPAFAGMRLSGKPNMFEAADINPMLTPMFVDMPVADFAAMVANAEDQTTGDYKKLHEIGLKLGIPDPEQTDEYGNLIDSNINAWNDWLVALNTNYHRFAFTRHEVPLSTVDAAVDINNTTELEIVSTPQPEPVVVPQPEPVVVPQPEPVVVPQQQETEVVTVDIELPNDLEIQTIFNQLINNYTSASYVVKYTEDKAKQTLSGTNSWLLLSEESSNKQSVSAWESALNKVDKTNMAVRLANEQATDTEFRKQKGLDTGKQFTPPTEINKAALVRYAVWDNLNTHSAIVYDAQKLMYGTPGLLESVLKNVAYTAEYAGVGVTPKMKTTTTIPEWSAYPDEFVVDFVDFYSRTDLENWTIPEKDINRLNQYTKSVTNIVTDKKYNIPESLLQSAILHLSGLSQEEINFVLGEE